MIDIIPVLTYKNPFIFIISFLLFHFNNYNVVIYCRFGVWIFFFF